MRGRSFRFAMGVFVAGLTSALVALGAGGPTSTPLDMAQVIVTVHARHGGAYPVVDADDVRVYEDNKSRPVVSWVEAKTQSGPLDLTLLIDDSVRSNVSLQFKDLADFFPTLPAGSLVRVAYAEYGGNRIVQDFTSDYALAAKALRLPEGSMMAGGSIYDSITDLIKKWPADGHLHSLLVISDGIDFTDGFIDTNPDLNMLLQRTIDVAQSANVPIYTIFARGARSLEGNWYLLEIGQNCLLRLTDETGGQAYFQVYDTPLDFAPYLRQFANDLHHQCLLTFQPSPTPHGGYARLRVTPEIRGVKLSAPARIFIPKAG